MKTPIAIAALIQSLVGPLAISQQSAPESFRITDVNFAARIDYPLQRLEGTVEYRLENWTKSPSSHVSLLLNRLMEASSITDSAGNKLSFSQDVVRFGDQEMRQVTQIKVDFPRAIMPGTSTKIRVDYRGNLVGYTEIGWLYVKDRIDTTFTLIREDALAFPVVGGLSNAANRAVPRSNFAYRAAVTVPAGYVVATGGSETRQTNADGTVTWRYSSLGKSPFLNIAIAPYDTLSADGVKLFYFHGDSVGARRVMSKTNAALRELTTWFGPQRNAVALSVFEIPEDWGSQANLIGGIMQTASAFKDSDRLGELYHELSHLWNVTDSDVAPARWNEGLAMFAQDLLRERLDGWTGRKDRHTRLIASLREQISNDSAYRTVPFALYGQHSMTDRSYSVGRLMFAVLYEIVGSQKFNEVIAKYYRDNPRGISTRDFATLAIRNTNPKLEKFFNDWMFTTAWTKQVAEGATLEELAAGY